MSIHAKEVEGIPNGHTVRVMFAPGLEMLHKFRLAKNLNERDVAFRHRGHESITGPAAVRSSPVLFVDQADGS